MEMWRQVWRTGLAPGISVQALKALAEALKQNDDRLIQGATTQPPPNLADWPVEAACALGFCGWSMGLETVGEVHEYFGRMVLSCDLRMGETGAIRHFTNWFDDAKRGDLRHLLAEVEQELQLRGHAAA